MAFKTKEKKEPKTLGSVDIQNTIDAIKTKFGEEAIMKLGEKPRVGIDAIPTGSIGLDAALGRLHEHPALAAEGHLDRGRFDPDGRKGRRPLGIRNGFVEGSAHRSIWAEYPFPSDGSHSRSLFPRLPKGNPRGASEQAALRVWMRNVILPGIWRATRQSDRSLPDRLPSTWRSRLAAQPDFQSSHLGR